jgi:cytosine/adenosine deaminase-related metal-dependent hydrolase
VTRVLSADWVLPVERPPIEGGAVVIENGRIAAVGRADDLGTGNHYPDAVIVPGFVNAHSHFEYAVYAGFGDALADFAEWIRLHTERKWRLGLDEYVAIARLGAAQLLASGVTTVGDCSYSGAAAVAAAELGLRAIVYLEVFGAEPTEAIAHFEELRERVPSAGHVTVGVSPHAPYSVSPGVYRACGELGVPVATHISESESEVRYLLDGGGAWSGIPWLVEPPRTTGTRLLEREGLLGPGVLAAHCVRLDPDEIAMLAAHDVAVAHCPRSNAYVGCGIAPLRELRAAGLRIGIGTDGVSSTPSHDYFDELRAAVMMARARERRPDALTAAEAVELGTLGGARALGLADDVGSLVPGKRADLAVLSLAGSPYLPVEDPAAAVVFGGSPGRILATFVDGEERYEKGAFGWHELTGAARSARRAMLARPGADARAAAGAGVPAAAAVPAGRPPAP